MTCLAMVKREERGRRTSTSLSTSLIRTMVQGALPAMKVVRHMTVTKTTLLAGIVGEAAAEVPARLLLASLLASLLTSLLASLLTAMGVVEAEAGAEEGAEVGVWAEVAKVTIVCLSTTQMMENFWVTFSGMRRPIPWMSTARARGVKTRIYIAI